MSQPIDFIDTSMSIFEHLFVIGAAIFGINAFDKWRQEIIYKERLNSAREIYKSYRKLIKVFDEIRNPWGSGEEGKNLAEKDKTESPNRGHILHERIFKHNEFFSSLNDKQEDFLFVFGDDYEQLFTQLVPYYNQLVSIGNRYRLGVDSSNMSREEIGEEFNIIYRSFNSEEDKFGQAVKEACKEICNLCRDFISNPEKYD